MKRISLVFSVAAMLLFFTWTFAKNSEQLNSTKNITLTNFSGQESIDVLDPGYYVHYSLIDMGVDSHGNPHISYRNKNRDLSYATIQNGTWVTEVVSLGTVARENAIALDANDRPHICYSYSDGSDENLHYARNMTGTWQLIPVDAPSSSSVGLECAIAIDSNGSVHISYWKWNGQDLKYATNVSGDWVAELVDTGVVAWDRTAIAVDSQNNAHIVYHESNQLTYATNSSGQWEETQMAGCTTPCGPAVAMDDDDILHIVFSYDSAVQYMTNAADASPEVVVPNVNPAQYHDIVIDKNNKPHISYFDPDDTSLGYAHKTNEVWRTEIVDNGCNVGGANAIAVDSIGSVYFGYREAFTSASILRALAGAGTDLFAAGSAAEGGGGTVMQKDSTCWDKMPTGKVSSLMGIWVNNSNDVYAVGSSGTILHYDGQSWQSMDSGTTVGLQGIWGSGPDNLFAVGSSGTILHFDGQSWSLMPSSSTSVLFAAWGNAADDVYAVGQGSTILHFDGNIWQPVDTGLAVTVDFRDIWGDAATGDLFIVGTDGTIIHSDGNSWETMDTGVLNSFYGIWGVSATDLFVVGSSGIILHFDGNSWEGMDKATTQNLYDVWGTSSQDVYAVGGNRSDSNGVLLHYNGSTWALLGDSHLKFASIPPAKIFLPFVVKE